MINTFIFVNLAKKGASLGGIAVSKKYPHEHYQKIGKMTGEIHGREKLSEWGKRGGITTASKQKLTEQEELIKKILENYTEEFADNYEVKPFEGVEEMIDSFERATNALLDSKISLIRHLKIDIFSVNFV